ncbi:MAG: ABC transporter permease [Caldilineaceae bacterium]|nr:ABC transporter permease [Caldilineaceae bacterium]MCB9161355.1 ABC transporter permease [Caldilineaceae bacterium]
MPVYQYILRRLALTVPLIIGVTLIAFIISHAVPADPVTANLGQKAMSDPEIVAAFRAEWGLDDPVPQQYFTYVTKLLQGDMGRSIKSRRAVAEDIRAFLPATIELATTAIFFGVIIGILLGVLSSLFRNSWIDHLARFVSLLGVSLPVFWLALLALQIVYAQLGWAAGPGRLDVGLEPPPHVTGLYTIDALLAGQVDIFLNALHHLLLPAIVLGSYTTGLITRVTRSAMLEVLGEDYVRTARAKGLASRKVVMGHAFRNALIPVVTVIGFSYGNLLAGAVLTESIFAWPGIGQYAYRASASLDFPAIMGVSLVIALIFILVNLIVDVLYFWLDPRLRAA